MPKVSFELIHRLSSSRQNSDNNNITTGHSYALQLSIVNINSQPVKRFDMAELSSLADGMRRYFPTMNRKSIGTNICCE